MSEPTTYTTKQSAVLAELYKRLVASVHSRNHYDCNISRVNAEVLIRFLNPVPCCQDKKDY